MGAVQQLGGLGANAYPTVGISTATAMTSPPSAKISLYGEGINGFEFDTFKLACIKEDKQVMETEKSICTTHAPVKELLEKLALGKKYAKIHVVNPDTKDYIFTITEARVIIFDLSSMSPFLHDNSVNNMTIKVRMAFDSLQFDEDARNLYNTLLKGAPEKC